VLRIPPGGPTLEGALLERPNRFLATVELPGGESVRAHVPNPGRMHEFMTPGRRLMLRPAATTERRTTHDLLAVHYAGQWVCIDNRIGAKLARLALESAAVTELQPYREVSAEVVCGASRLDFRLTGDGPACWVEVKSCTLVEDGHGRFPDAPTVRGRRHVGELIERVAAGDRAAVMFIIQRPDARSIGPNDETDPDFGDILRAASAAGVTLVGYTGSWSADGLTLGQSVPVVTDRR